jgi:hypothetical protein
MLFGRVFKASSSCCGKSIRPSWFHKPYMAAGTATFLFRSLKQTSTATGQVSMWIGQRKKRGICRELSRGKPSA